MRKKEIGLAILILLFFAGAFYAGVYQLFPPAAMDENAHREVFSAQRALAHLMAIGKEPRFPGQEYHGQARDYIIKTLEDLQITTEVQDTITVVPDFRQIPFASGRVQNILGAIPGENSQGTILLMAHYDSVPLGPGVGDNAIAVAAMLEAARALMEMENRQNDILLLFTDGHEMGLLGARAFLNQHPLAREVDLVFNFEGQGPHGPVYMFETSNYGKDLIHGLRKGVSYPLASSISADIYDVLNFDNDFRLFADGGYTGLGMAIISDMAFYHSERDSLENMSLASVQHQGEYVLGLAKYFAQGDIKGLDTRETVYFNLTKQHLLQYPQSWVLPLLIIGLLLFIITLILRKPPIIGFLMGFVLPIFIILFCTLMAMGFREFLDLGTYTQRSHLIQGGLAGIAAFVTLLNFYVSSKGFSLQTMGMGACLNWLLLAGLTAFLLPGGSYIFIWPLLLSTLFFLIPKKVQAKLPFFPAFVQVFFLTPLIVILFRSLTLDLVEIPLALFILLLTLCLPALQEVFTLLKWWLPTVIACIAVALLFAGFSAPDRQYPHSNTLSYYLDTEQNQAYLVSMDQQLDAWTLAYVGQTPRRGTVPPLDPFAFSQYLYQEAPVAPIPGPQVHLLEEDVTFEHRKYRLHLSSPRTAPVALIYVEHGIEIQYAAINSTPITRGFSPDWYWGLRFIGLPPEGIELEFWLPREQHLTLHIFDQSYGLQPLKDIGWEDRPEEMMGNPEYFRNTDSIFLGKSFQW